MSQTCLPEVVWLVCEIDPGGQYYRQGKLFSTKEAALDYKYKKRDGVWPNDLAVYPLHVSPRDSWANYRFLRDHVFNKAMAWFEKKHEWVGDDMPAEAMPLEDQELFEACVHYNKNKGDDRAYVDYDT